MAAPKKKISGMKKMKSPSFTPVWFPLASE